jgi:hypothetical protein
LAVVVEVHGVLCWGRQAADFFAEPPKIDVNAFWIHIFLVSRLVAVRRCQHSSTGGALHMADELVYAPLAKLRHVTVEGVPASLLHC